MSNYKKLYKSYFTNGDLLSKSHMNYEYLKYVIYLHIRQG